MIPFKVDETRRYWARAFGTEVPFDEQPGIRDWVIHWCDEVKRALTEMGRADDRETFDGWMRRHAEMEGERRQVYRALGWCYGCGAVVGPHRARCDYCIAGMSFGAMLAARAKARRERRRCGNGGCKRFAVSDRPRRCAICLQAYQRRRLRRRRGMRRARREVGMCVRCRSWAVPGPDGMMLSLCERHLAENRAAVAASRAARKIGR